MESRPVEFEQGEIPNSLTQALGGPSRNRDVVHFWASGLIYLERKGPWVPDLTDVCEPEGNGR